MFLVILAWKIKDRIFLATEVLHRALKFPTAGIKI